MLDAISAPPAPMVAQPASFWLVCATRTTPATTAATPPAAIHGAAATAPPRSWRGASVTRFSDACDPFWPRSMIDDAMRSIASSTEHGAQLPVTCATGVPPPVSTSVRMYEYVCPSASMRATRTRPTSRARDRGHARAEAAPLGEIVLGDRVARGRERDDDEAGEAQPLGDGVREAHLCRLSHPVRHQIQHRSPFFRRRGHGPAAQEEED